MTIPTPITALQPATFFKKLATWSQRMKLARLIFFILLTSIIFSGYLTYSAIINKEDAFGPDPYAVMGLILLDMTLFLAMMVLISRNLLGLWISRQSRMEGTRLQTRIILMFSLVASLPTILVAIFSALLFHIGIEAWFNDRVSTAIEESVTVAQAYMEEHNGLIRTNALEIAAILNQDAYDLNANPELLNNVLNHQASIRSLSDAIVFHPNNKVLAQTNLSFPIIFEQFPTVDLEKADRGDVVILQTNNDEVMALIKLKSYFNTYLIVGRFIDDKVIEHVERTKGASSQYKRLKKQIISFQVKFSIIFAIFALLMLLAAIGFGLRFASMIANPIHAMVQATDRVKAGDFTARVREGPKHDEIAILGRAFNRMTEQLNQQREGLIDANRQLDARRHFSETVLTGVSAGIIAISNEKTVSLINPSAQAILGISDDELTEDFIGKNFLDYIPEMASLLEVVEKMPDNPSQGEVSLMRHGKKLILLVRITAEKRPHVEGYVITFDDITDFVSIQRKSAWADVARRIAHEIKNPLTPIHLAAERLKRKYSKEVSEPETFVKYTDTIIRHVKDIGNIVEEFVNFARMPAPVFADTDLGELVRNTVFSQQCLGTETIYTVSLPNTPVMIHSDASQLNQTILNILKNAEESIESRDQPSPPGTINLTLTLDEKYAHLMIIDNGKGFPESLLDRITEPYVTTRTKGTGLGLAIVKKIVEDHNGMLTLGNNPEGGAYVRLSFLLG